VVVLFDVDLLFLFRLTLTDAGPTPYPSVLCM
jgi:hypothetical protein